jgi:hypothetical protein
VFQGANTCCVHAMGVGCGRVRGRFAGVVACKRTRCGRVVFTYACAHVADVILQEPLFAAEGGVFRESLECAIRIARGSAGGMVQTFPPFVFQRGTASLLRPRL